MSSVANSDLKVIYLLVLLSGVVLVLVSTIEMPPMIGASLRAMGTGLISAGFVGFLIRYLQAEDRSRYIEFFALNRKRKEREYRRRKFRSDYIRIIAIALRGALEDYSTKDRLLQRVLSAKAIVELLFLNPSSPAILQRASEDKQEVRELREGLLKSVRLSHLIFEKLKQLHDDSRDKFAGVGKFEIRLLNECPHYTIFNCAVSAAGTRIADKRILWGMYTSTGMGFNNCVLEVNDKQAELFEQLQRHSDNLWTSHADDWLLRYHGSDPPKWNDELVKEIEIKCKNEQFSDFEVRRETYRTKKR
jgi:hypothetical protein